MENNRPQRLTALTVILIILCCIEIYFFSIDIFLILKQIICSLGGFAIICYLYLIGSVLTED